MKNKYGQPMILSRIVFHIKGHHLYKKQYIRQATETRIVYALRGHNTRLDRLLITKTIVSAYNAVASVNVMDLSNGCEERCNKCAILVFLGISLLHSL